MTAHTEALSIIERGNLDYHAGCVLIAILDGDMDKAAFHIERKRVLQSTSTPVAALKALPAPQAQRAYRIESGTRSECAKRTLPQMHVMRQVFSVDRIPGSHEGRM